MLAHVMGIRGRLTVSSHREWPALRATGDLPRPGNSEMPQQDSPSRQCSPGFVVGGISGTRAETDHKRLAP